MSEMVFRLEKHRKRELRGLPKYIQRNTSETLKKSPFGVQDFRLSNTLCPNYSVGMKQHTPGEGAITLTVFKSRRRSFVVDRVWQFDLDLSDFDRENDWCFKELDQRIKTYPSISFIPKFENGVEIAPDILIVWDTGYVIYNLQSKTYGEFTPHWSNGSLLEPWVQEMYNRIEQEQHYDLRILPSIYFLCGAKIVRLGAWCSKQTEGNNSVVTLIEDTVSKSTVLVKDESVDGGYTHSISKETLPSFLQKAVYPYASTAIHYNGVLYILCPSAPVYHDPYFGESGEVLVKDWLPSNFCVTELKNKGFKNASALKKLLKEYQAWVKLQTEQAKAEWLATASIQPLICISLTTGKITVKEIALPLILNEYAVLHSLTVGEDKMYWEFLVASHDRSTEGRILELVSPILTDI